jgi:hypothetical protein
MIHHPGGGDSMHLRNVSLLQDYTALYARKLSSSSSCNGYKFLSFGFLQAESNL